MFVDNMTQKTYDPNAGYWDIRRNGSEDYSGEWQPVDSWTATYHYPRLGRISRGSWYRPHSAAGEWATLRLHIVGRRGKGRKLRPAWFYGSIRFLTVAVDLVSAGGEHTFTCKSLADAMRKAAAITERDGLLKQAFKAAYVHDRCVCVSRQEQDGAFVPYMTSFVRFVDWRSLSPGKYLELTPPGSSLPQRRGRTNVDSYGMSGASFDEDIPVGCIW